MERIINDNEKVRRAEDIYFRRRNLMGNNTYTEKKSIKDKVLFNALLLINIAVIVFCVQNKEYIFTDAFLSSVDQYNLSIKDKIISIVGNIVNDDKEENIEKENIIEETQEEQIIDDIASPAVENVVEEEKASSLSEMEEDVKNLKASYSFLKPIDGTITSSFGLRTSENKNVAGYHTGTDIGAPKGTIIKASMGGIVTLVSSEGDYGKHIKIRCNNITTLYAHCSKIYVKEGQIVAQGQAIGEVGTTGNTTGPHLHFEIRIDDSRFVDPEEII